MLKINLYGRVAGKFTLIKTLDNADSLFTAILKMSSFAGNKGLKEVAKFSSTGGFMADTYLYSDRNESVMIKIEKEAA